jgi:hypothetical protein
VTRIGSRRSIVLVAALASLTWAALAPGSAGAGKGAARLSSTTRLSFAKPVYVTQGPDFQAAEPSIRVDRTDPHQRIWVVAPTGIGPDTRSLPGGPESGDLFWYSDDNGKTWHYVTGNFGSPTIVGGGDTDVAPARGQQVFGTGLTLANTTLAVSCDNGATWHSNPISNTESAEDRQWIDVYDDRPRPANAPDFVMDYGSFGPGHVIFHQVHAPNCMGPFSGPAVDVTAPGCNTNPDNCYQWPGNLAIDERTGDVYVAYNTFNDKIVVTRVDGGASRSVSQGDVHPYVAERRRSDTFDSFTVVAVDRAGNLYVVWSERHRHSRTTAIMLAVSRNEGVTWSKPVKVNEAPQTTTFPWVVAGRAGRIDIVYYGTGAHGRSPEKVPDTAKWKVWMAQSLNALAADPSFTEAPATGVIHKGSICTSGTDCKEGTRDLLDFFQVDVDAQGWANIAYTDDFTTPPDPNSNDPHQEWITFVQQNGGKRLFGR